MLRVKLADGTGYRDYKYAGENMDRHGNVRIYVRKGGKYLGRIRAPLGTEEFDAEYNDILKGVRPAEKPQAPTKWPAGSLGWLCTEHFASGEFKGLDSSTQTVRKRILNTLCDGHGAKPYKRLEKRHVRKWRDGKVETPEAANALVKNVRAVFKWAIETGEYGIDLNPATDIPKLKPKNPNGHHTWTVGEIGIYEKRHPLGTKARKAFAIFKYTGVRLADAAKLGPQHEKVNAEGIEVLAFYEDKGDGTAPKYREIPILPPLREALDACPSGHLSYLVTEYGKPFSTKGLGNKMRDWCDDAGLHHCSAHGIRKEGATTAAENAATEYDLMSMFGWKDPQSARTYTRKANLNKIAAKRMHLIAPASQDHTGNADVTLSDWVPEGVAEKAKKAL